MADFNAAPLFFLPALPCRPFPLEGFDFYLSDLNFTPGFVPGFFMVDATKP
ncbi:hypothetical protein [Microvirga vignae]|uniref:hypothetical protein n=1 Tax=Microvirga vignae TaxID=1225564 RepID=UPI001AEC26CD|nr:hypothetical protein [Microvirga vignae]